jgi:hypothetical protein
MRPSAGDDCAFRRKAAGRRGGNDIEIAGEKFRDEAVAATVLKDEAGRPSLAQRRNPSARPANSSTATDPITSLT